MKGSRRLPTAARMALHWRGEEWAGRDPGASLPTQLLCLPAPQCQHVPRAPPSVSHPRGRKQLTQEPRGGENRPGPFSRSRGPTVSFKPMAASALEASIPAPSVLCSRSGTQRWDSTSRLGCSRPRSRSLWEGKRSRERGAGEKRGKKRRKGLGPYFKLKIASIVGSHNYKGVNQRGT